MQKLNFISIQVAKWDLGLPSQFRWDPIPFVIPIDESSKSIVENFRCFTMNYQAMINQFIEEDGTFKYSVQIRNLKEEAKDDNGISDDE